MLYCTACVAKRLHRTELGAVADRSQPDAVTTRNVPRLAGLVTDHNGVFTAAL